MNAFGFSLHLKLLKVFAFCITLNRHSRLLQIPDWQPKGQYSRIENGSSHKRLYKLPVHRLNVNVLLSNITFYYGQKTANIKMTFFGFRHTGSNQCTDWD